MANLLAEWLILAGVKVSDVQAMVENNLKDMILKTFDPKKADKIFTEEGEVCSLTLNTNTYDSCTQSSMRFLPDSCLVDRNDSTPHMEVSHLQTRRGIPGLSNVEFHHKGKYVFKCECLK